VSNELDRALAAVTELADVPETARDEFRRSLLGAIDEANKCHEFERNIHSPHPGVESFMNPIVAAARDLDSALAWLQSEIANSGEHSTAALQAAAFLQFQIMVLLMKEPADWRAESDRLERHEHTAWIVEYRQSLARLIAPTLSRGRLKGDFHYFIRRLFQIAERTGGRWTHSKAPDKSMWDGSLMRALQIMRPFLPSEGFFPKGNLGRSLEDLRARITT
jgi:hypothetical protein